MVATRRQRVGLHSLPKPLGVEACFNAPRPDRCVVAAAFMVQHKRRGSLKNIYSSGAGSSSAVKSRPRVDESDIIVARWTSFLNSYLPHHSGLLPPPYPLPSAAQNKESEAQGKTNASYWKHNEAIFSCLEDAFTFLCTCLHLVPYVGDA